MSKVICNCLQVCIHTIRCPFSSNRNEEAGWYMWTVHEDRRKSTHIHICTCTIYNTNSVSFALAHMQRSASVECECGINSSLLCNNVLIHWWWSLLLLLVGYCQRVELLTFGFLPHSTVVHHSTNQCSNNEWNSAGDDCCNSYTSGTWARGASCIDRWKTRMYTNII